MSEGKIRITSDDVAKASALPSNPSMPPLLGVPGFGPVAPPPPRAHTGLSKRAIITGAVAVLITIVIAAIALSPRSPSIENYVQEQRKMIDSELSTSGRTQAKSLIENIHPLVTFRGANVKSIRATTIDGSPNPGKNGENISELLFVVTYHWEGPVQKNGFTEVEYVFDVPANKMKGSRYLASNATVNLDTIDWFRVGVEVGAALFGGN